MIASPQQSLVVTSFLPERADMSFPSIHSSLLAVLRIRHRHQRIAGSDLDLLTKDILAVSLRLRTDGSPVLLALCFSYPVAIQGRIVWVSSGDTLTNDQTFVVWSLGDESPGCVLGWPAGQRPG